MDVQGYALVNDAMDDQDAIKRCRDGEVDAFRGLVERYQAEALSHARALLGNRADAADAVQEAFIKAFQALARFEPGRKFYPWFYTILRHCCFKLAKRRERFDNQPGDELCLLAAPEAGAKEQQTRQLERALLQLAVEDRELITLKHLDGLSYDELASRLEIPPGTVMSRLYHARQRLRQELEKVLEQDL